MSNPWVKITKIKSTHNMVRDTPLEGAGGGLPRVGRPYYVMGLARLIWTTEVQRVVKFKTHWRFYTKNSSYRLDLKW